MLLEVRSTGGYDKTIETQTLQDNTRGYVNTLEKHKHNKEMLVNTLHTLQTQLLQNTRETLETQTLQDDI